MKLTKKLNQTIKALEVKGLDQLKAMTTVTLNGHMTDLNNAIKCDMDEEKKETVEVLINDINDILKERLIDTLVADKKTAKKDSTSTTNKTEKTAKKDTKKTTKKTTKKDDKAPTKEATDKPKKAPNKPKKTTKKTSLKDVLKWKSLVKMTIDDSIHYCYIVDIAPNFENVIARSTDDINTVFLFDTIALDTFSYTEPSGDKWKLEYMGKELK